MKRAVLAALAALAVGFAGSAMAAWPGAPEVEVSLATEFDDFMQATPLLRRIAIESCAPLPADGVGRARTPRCRCTEARCLRRPVAYVRERGGWGEPRALFLHRH